MAEGAAETREMMGADTESVVMLAPCAWRRSPFRASEVWPTRGPWLTWMELSPPVLDYDAGALGAEDRE